MGESHLGVVLLTRDRGLLYTLAHGAAKTKGKLRVLAQGFSEIQVELYHDPVADSWKITDAQEIYYPRTLGESLEKYYVVCFWAEMILKSYGSGGEAQGVFDLITQGLRLLDRPNSTRLEALKFQILWRYFTELGWGPDFSTCVRCGRSMEGEKAFFSMEDHGLTCLLDRWPTEPEVLPGVSTYLKRTLGQELEESLRVGLTGACVQNLKHLGESYLERLIGSGLKTLKVGRNIL